MSRRLLALLLTAAAAATPAFPAGAQPTEIVPEAVPTESSSLYGTIGIGAVGWGSDRFHANTPALVTTFGGSLPVKGKAYVDLGATFSIAGLEYDSPESVWMDDALLQTIAFTASVRGGHVGRDVAVYGSGGIGFAWARVGEPYGFGVYPEPIGTALAPVLTVAGSLERPVPKRSRFLMELRYTWMNADFGGGAGSLNAGGVTLTFGWRGVF